MFMPGLCCGSAECSNKSSVRKKKQINEQPVEFKMSTYCQHTVHIHLRKTYQKRKYMSVQKHAHFKYMRWTFSLFITEDIPIRFCFIFKFRFCSEFEGFFCSDSDFHFDLDSVFLCFFMIYIQLSSILFHLYGTFNNGQGSSIGMYRIWLQSLNVLSFKYFFFFYQIKKEPKL